MSSVEEKIKAGEDYVRTSATKECAENCSTGNQACCENRQAKGVCCDGNAKSTSPHSDALRKVTDNEHDLITTTSQPPNLL